MVFFQVEAAAKLDNSMFLQQGFKYCRLWKCVVFLAHVLPLDYRNSVKIACSSKYLLELGFLVLFNDTQRRLGAQYNVGIPTI
jgi:hypothetical protein